MLLIHRELSLSLGSKAECFEVWYCHNIVNDEHNKARLTATKREKDFKELERIYASIKDAAKKD